MRTLPFFVTLVGLLAPAAMAQPESAPPRGDLDPERTRLTQLQVFLDNANFGPGKIDGRWGEFTRKALAIYLAAQGGKVPAFGDEAPEDFGVDLAAVEPVLTTYTVTEEDLKQLGTVPREPEAQAEQKGMPYANLSELVAERNHVDQAFLRELNPGRNLDELKAGDSLTVPNVARPFLLAEVQQLAAAESARRKRNKDADGDEDRSDGDADKAAGPGSASAEPAASPESGADARVHTLAVDTAERMLTLYENDRVVAAYPITPGSEALPAPKGEWRIVAIRWMPWFRHDESMLKRGTRSDDAHNIPPGPNNAVGIVWMALNRDGIGIHGTAEPDAIGRSASHGCIRLANWDALALGRTLGGSDGADGDEGKGPRVTIR